MNGMQDNHIAGTDTEIEPDNCTLIEDDDDDRATIAATDAQLAHMCANIDMSKLVAELEDMPQCLEAVPHIEAAPKANAAAKASAKRQLPSSFGVNDQVMFYNNKYD